MVGLITLIAFPLLQSDLDQVVSVWKCHQIRPTKNQNMPHGKPAVLFTIPEVYATTAYMNPVGHADIDICLMACIFRNGCPCGEDVFELAVIYIAECDLEQPTNAHEALDLYLTLRTCLVCDL